MEWKLNVKKGTVFYSVPMEKDANDCISGGR
jgi:hypothetical protein